VNDAASRCPRRLIDIPNPRSTESILFFGGWCEAKTYRRTT